MTNRGFALFLIVACLFSGQASAQTESTAAQLYGRGTYAFNAGQYADAIVAFDQMEQAATDDPRVFFFRGLSHLRSGNEAAATTDFQTASKMELTVSGRSYSVPKALERIQGQDRILIERYRRAAKKTWEADQNKRRQDEFLAEKEKNRQVYDNIIRSGEAAAATMPQTFEPDIKVPFGANPVMPFGQKELGVQQTNLVGVSGSGFTEDNIFKEDVTRKVEIEVPEEPAPKAPSRPQDGFDNFDFGETTEVEGFDVGNLLEGADNSSRPSFGAISNIFGGGDDDFDSPFGTPDTTGSGDFEDDGAFPIWGGDSDSPFDDDDSASSFGTPDTTDSVDFGDDDVSPFGGGDSDSPFDGGSDDFGDFGAGSGSMNGGMGFDMPPGGMSDGGSDDFGDFGAGSGSMNGGMGFDVPPGGMSDGGMTISVTPNTGEPAKDAGRSFGGAFASLFKKSGTSKTPNQPAPTTKPTDSSATDNDGFDDDFDSIFDGGDDSGGDSEADPFGDESDDEFSDPFDDF